MGIEEWRPMGSGGDPLRDPTNFYSPPQVQHVHYWLKSPSVSLEPPPSRVVGLGQVPGWPQVMEKPVAEILFKPFVKILISILWR